MTYGSGTPNWGKGGNHYNMNDTPNQGGMNSRHQGGYQSNAGGSYQPPRVTGNYAEQQTGVLEDTMRTQYQVRRDISIYRSEEHTSELQSPS